MATLVRRVGVRELRLHRTVTGRLRRCSAEPTRGRGERVGRRVGTSLRCGYLITVHARAEVPRGRSGGALDGAGRARRILIPFKGIRGGKGLTTTTEVGPGFDSTSPSACRSLTHALRVALYSGGAWLEDVYCYRQCTSLSSTGPASRFCRRARDRPGRDARQDRVPETSLAFERVPGTTTPSPGISTCGRAHGRAGLRQVPQKRLKRAHRAPDGHGL